MVPRLDLSRSTPGKVMIAPSRINLRRTASYNDRSAATVSSTTSRLNFNHLLFSPPPSPSLPALVPRRKRSASQELFRSRPSRVIRTVFYFLAVLAFLYTFAFVFRNRNVIPIALPYFKDAQYEMIGQDSFPEFPTPVVVYDAKKRSQWTVSIPRNYEFPLSIEEYSSMNGLCREVSARARDLHHKSALSDQTLLSYDQPDDYFVDVHEAEQAGLLSVISKGQPPKHSGRFVGVSFESMSGKPFCDQSLIYVLESPNAGLGDAVMAMWTLYSLAKEQGRSFFIDDSRWAYGTYTDLFQPPPIPNCRPPPRHQMLPCPAQTRHLVVSSVTIKDVLPVLLTKHQREGQTDLGRKDLFELAHAGYKSLFKLSKEDQDYVAKRVRNIRAKAQYTKLPVDLPIIGLHIRHGDRHPHEYQYREGYIPSEVFAGYGSSQVEAHYNQTNVSPDQYEVVRVIASDDPMVHQEPEFSDAMLAQERIQLATKQVIEDANTDPHYLHHSVDEAFGWEGGFFAAMFWNLGEKPKNNAVEEGRGSPPSEETLRLRNLVGRAYMMDMAVLAGASDKVVCAVSAMGCRLLAVMMGWERAIEHEDWVNVDGEYGWSGLTW
ncbi:hypothetical protein QQS21_007034 [Conoideocrella luteorostrata]|uniref:Uncharacterized protein n=1 Tax=Conoideocrella luteorostrata TaxID=1105319 RepID=A0AAJ0CMC6_9HYPO|nr:hypothetical protein QQS21_007034 [Conoideocrella luteorostrata]